MAIVHNMFSFDIIYALTWDIDSEKELLYVASDGYCEPFIKKGDVIASALRSTQHLKEYIFALAEQSHMDKIEALHKVAIEATVNLISEGPYFFSREEIRRINNATMKIFETTQGK